MLYFYWAEPFTANQLLQALHPPYIFLASSLSLFSITTAS